MVQACSIIHPFFALPMAPVYALPAIPSCGSFCPPLELYALLAVELYALLVEVLALLGKFLPSLLVSRAQIYAQKKWIPPYNTVRKVLRLCSSDRMCN
jgi:hypothetical protein